MFDWINKIFGPRELEPDPDPVEHPTLGTLVYQDSGWWAGTLDTEWGKIEVNVTGDLVEPDSVEVDALVRRVSSYADLRHEAMRFLAREVRRDNIDVAKFEVTAIDHLWSHGGGHFFVDFSHSDDPHSIWRVEYVDGRATHVSCDR